MQEYKKQLAITLAETGALFFDSDLILKDGRTTPYFVNFGMFRKGRSSMKLGSFFADMRIRQILFSGPRIKVAPLLWPHPSRYMQTMDMISFSNTTGKRPRPMVKAANCQACLLIGRFLMIAGFLLLMM